MDGDDRDRGTGRPGKCRQAGRFWRAVAVALCISIPALAFLTFDSTGQLIRGAFITTAEAGHKNGWNGWNNWNSGRRAQQEAERARREAEEAARRAAEAARRAAEEAARRARQAAEQAGRNTRNQQSDNSRTQSGKDDKRTETADNNKKNDGKDEDDEDAKRSDDDDQNGRRRRGAQNSDDDADQPPPATVVDLLNRWVGKGKGAPEWSGKTSVIRPGNQASADKAQDGVMRVTPPGTADEPPPQSSKNNQGNQSAKSPEPQQSTGKAAAAPPTPRAQRGARALAMPPLPVMNQRELLAINVNRQSLDKVLAKGFEAQEEVNLSHLGFSMVRVEAPPGMDAKDARAWLRRELPNDRFEYNRTYRHYQAATGSDDFDPPGHRAAPLPPLPCGSDRCYAPATINWSPTLSSCAKEVRVGVIDTAVDPLLFADRQIHYANAAPRGQPKAASWHGNGVLALLSGASSGDMPGLIPDAKFFVADTFAADGDGQPVSDTASVLKALDLLSAFKVQVVNMSLSGPADETVRKAIEKLSREGVIFIAAAGNGGPTAPPAYPAAYPSVIAVTAVNRSLNGYPYANRGKYIDVAAPGVRIWTAVSKEKQDYLTGTSFATPYVTAIAAALAKSGGPVNKEAILARLAVKDLGAPGPDPVYGRGLVLAPTSCNPGPIRAPVASNENPWVVKTRSSP